MKILVTGASGFVGRALAKRLAGGGMPMERLTLLDAHMPDPGDDARVRVIVGDIAERAVRDRALDGGVDVVFHLAGMLSAIAEADPGLSRRVNLDASLSLFEDAARAGARPRVVFSSSIAVFGAALPSRVDDGTPPTPSLVYGAHKRMCELAIADASRRGEVDGIALRLPGIVARPFGGEATRSSFISDIFHAFQRGEAFVSPVSPDATFWILSVARCVDNLIHAARGATDGLPRSRALTLPALRSSVPELAKALAAATGRNADLVSYRPDASIEAIFGRYPPLSTEAADSIGFRHDGDVESLVKTVLESLQPTP